jgi:hypothetical protein
MYLCLHLLLCCSLCPYLPSPVTCLPIHFFKHPPDCRVCSPQLTQTILVFYFLNFLLLFYWEFIVAFAKVLSIYQSWIYPFHRSPLCTCTLYSYHIHPPTLFSCILLPPLVPNLRQDLFCLPVLCFFFLKWYFCLFKMLYREFPCDRPIL